MNNVSDPYREWLGIAAPERPLNYYQLLALKDFEEDPQRIENAEMIEMAKVLRHEAGPDAATARQLCEELERAVATLSDRGRKAAYDAELRLQREQHASIAVAAPSPVTLATSSVAPTGRSDDFSSDLRLDDDVDEDLIELARRPCDTVSTRPQVATVNVSTVAQAVKAAKASVPAHKPASRQEPATPAQADIKHKSETVKDVLEQFLAPPVELPQPRYQQLRSPWLLGVAGALALAFLAVWVVPAWWNAEPDAGPILARLQDPEPHARIDAIDAFRYLDLAPEEQTRHLLRVLKEDDCHAVRVAAANALSTIEPVPELISELQQLASTEEHTGIKNTLTWIVQESQQPMP